MKALIVATLVVVAVTPHLAHAQVYAPLPIPGQPFAPLYGTPPPPATAPYPSLPYAPLYTPPAPPTPTYETPSYHRAYVPPTFSTPSYSPPVYRPYVNSYSQPAPVAPPTTIYTAPSGRMTICSSSVIGTTVYTDCF